MNPQIGDTYRIYFNERNINNKTIHIRGIVDDIFVIRYWLKRKQRWYYACEPIEYFEAHNKHMTKVK